MKKLLLILSLIVFSATAVSSQSTKRMLDQSVQIMNRHCPKVLDDDTTLKQLIITGQYVVFDCTFNESETDIPTAKQHKKEIKKVFEKMLKQLAHNEDFATLFSYMASNREGLKFRLYGTTTHETLEINFSAGDIHDLID